MLDEKIRPSMSRKGNCWDNAAMESFFARFKVEALYAEDVTTKKEAYSCVFDYIELFYNSHRRHSTLGYRSPNHFEIAYEKGVLETVSTFGGEVQQPHDHFLR